MYTTVAACTLIVQLDVPVGVVVLHSSTRMRMLLRRNRHWHRIPSRKLTLNAFLTVSVGTLAMEAVAANTLIVHLDVALAVSVVVPHSSMRMRMLLRRNCHWHRIPSRKFMLNAFLTVSVGTLAVQAVAASTLIVHLDAALAVSVVVPHSSMRMRMLLRRNLLVWLTVSVSQTLEVGRQRMPAVVGRPMSLRDVVLMAIVVVLLRRGLVRMKVFWFECPGFRSFEFSLKHPSIFSNLGLVTKIRPQSVGLISVPRIHLCLVCVLAWTCECLRLCSCISCMSKC